jgi:hypothetical protein
MATVNMTMPDAGFRHHSVSWLNEAPQKSNCFQSITKLETLLAAAAHVSAFGEPR